MKAETVKLPCLKENLDIWKIFGHCLHFRIQWCCFTSLETLLSKLVWEESLQIFYAGTELLLPDMLLQAKGGLQRVLLLEKGEVGCLGALFVSLVIYLFGLCCC